jgi:hypothetical protein
MFSRTMIYLRVTSDQSNYFFEPWELYGQLIVSIYSTMHSFRSSRARLLSYTFRGTCISFNMCFLMWRYLMHSSRYYSSETAQKHIL